MRSGHLGQREPTNDEVHAHFRRRLGWVGFAPQPFPPRLEARLTQFLLVTEHPDRLATVPLLCKSLAPLHPFLSHVSTMLRSDRLRQRVHVMRTLQALQDALDDKNWSVRAAAVHAIERRNDRLWTLPLFLCWMTPRKRYGFGRLPARHRPADLGDGCRRNFERRVRRTRLVMQVVDNNIEKRTMNRQPSTVVVNETQLSEFVHEEAHP